MESSVPPCFSPLTCTPAPQGLPSLCGISLDHRLIPDSCRNESGSDIWRSRATAAPSADKGPLGPAPVCPGHAVAFLPRPSSQGKAKSRRRKNSKGSGELPAFLAGASSPPRHLPLSAPRFLFALTAGPSLPRTRTAVLHLLRAPLDPSLLPNGEPVPRCRCPAAGTGPGSPRDSPGSGSWPPVRGPHHFRGAGWQGGGPRTWERRRGGPPRRPPARPAGRSSRGRAPNTPTGRRPRPRRSGARPGHVARGGRCSCPPARSLARARVGVGLGVGAR